MRNIHLALGPCYRTHSPSHPTTPASFFVFQKKKAKQDKNNIEKTKAWPGSPEKQIEENLAIAIPAIAKIENKKIKKQKKFKSSLQNAGSMRALN